VAISNREVAGSIRAEAAAAAADAVVAVVDAGTADFLAMAAHLLHPTEGAKFSVYGFLSWWLYSMNALLRFLVVVSLLMVSGSLLSFCYAAVWLSCLQPFVTWLI
jgi:hypothetical protein